MAQGVRLSSFITTKNASDTYPTHEDNKGKGGIHSVDSIAQMNSIPFERRKRAMLCSVADTGDGSTGLYVFDCPANPTDAQLADNQYWERFNIGLEVNGILNFLGFQDALSLTILDSTGNDGDTYVVETGGSVNNPNIFGGNAVTLNVGDYLIYYNSQWNQVPTGASSVNWNTLAGKPSTFTPAPHTHVWADITDAPNLADYLLRAEITSTIDGTNPTYVPTELAVQNYVTSQLSGSLSDYYLQTEVDTLLNNYYLQSEVDAIIDAVEGYVLYTSPSLAQLAIDVPNPNEGDFAYIQGEYSMYRYESATWTFQYLTASSSPWVGNLVTGTGSTTQNALTSDVTAQTGTSYFNLFDADVTTSGRTSTGDINFLYFKQNGLATFEVATDGSITAGDDTDISTILGRARIDSRIPDLAYFSHYDMTANNQYALRQNSAGDTNLNTVLTGTIKVADANKLVWSTNNLRPAIDNDLTLGANGYGWSDLYLATGGNVYLGSTNTGIGETTANRVGTIIGGSTLFEWYTDGMVSSTPYFPVIRNDVGGFTWQSEATTKLYRTGVNAVAIANDGTDTIQFDATNNVTIPNGVLYVNGASSNPATADVIVPNSGRIAGDNFSGTYAQFSSNLILNANNGLVFGNGALTSTIADEVLVSLSGSINKASGTNNYTGIKLNVTETAAPGADNRLLDLQVGGTSEFIVRSNGSVTTGSYIQVGEVTGMPQINANTGIAYSFQGDNDTYFRRTGGDTVGIFTGGFEGLGIDASQNVTIPNGSLILKKGGSAVSPDLYFDSPTSAGFYSATNSLSIAVAGGNYWTADTSGHTFQSVINLNSTSFWYPNTSATTPKTISVTPNISAQLTGHATDPTFDLFYANVTETGRTSTGDANLIRLEVNSSEMFKVDIAGNVTIPNGDLTVSADTDATTILGRARIDSRTTDVAYFSHYDMSANGQQALSQSSGGFVRVNAPTGQTVNFTINNIAQWQIDTNGNLDAQADQDINLGSGSAIQVASVDTITFDASQNVTIPNGDLTISSGKVTASIIESNTLRGANTNYGIDFNTTVNAVVNRNKYFSVNGHGFIVDQGTSNLLAMLIDNTGDVFIPNGDLTVGDPAGLNFTYGGLYFGDGNTGFKESADNILEVLTGGSTRFQYSGTVFLGINTGSARVNSQTPSTSNLVYSFNGDGNSGILWNSADNWSLYNGGVETMNFDASNNVTIPNGDLSLTQVARTTDGITNSNDFIINAQSYASLTAHSIDYAFSVIPLSNDGTTSELSIGYQLDGGGYTQLLTLNQGGNLTIERTAAQGGGISAGTIVLNSNRVGNGSSNGGAIVTGNASDTIATFKPSWINNSGIGGAGGDVTIITSGTAKFKVANAGTLQASQYGSGTVTGTETYALAVDASGNIIEVALGTGGWATAGTTTLTDSVTVAANFAGQTKFMDLNLENTTQGTKLQIYYNIQATKNGNIKMEASQPAGTISSYFQASTSGSFQIYGIDASGNAEGMYNTVGSGIQIEDDFGVGLSYNADYSTNGTALGDRWIPDKGYVDSVAGAFTADVDTQITPSTAIVLDHATNNEIALDLSYTVNKAAGNDTGLFMNKTVTAAPGTSYLLQFQVAASNVFTIDNNGGVSVAGNVASTATNGPKLQGENASATNPTLIPNKADANTGIGGISGEISLITGGVEAINISNSQVSTFAGKIIQNVTYSDASHIANSYTANIAAQTTTTTFDLFYANVVTVGRTSTGQDNLINFEKDGATVYRLDTDGAHVMYGDVSASNAGGYRLKNENASDINPTLLPDRTYESTGIGSAGANQLSFITGGIEAININATQVVELSGELTLSSTGVGLSSLPIRFANDPNTGLYNWGADSLGFATGGLFAGRFDSSQNLIVAGGITAASDTDSTHILGRGRIDSRFTDAFVLSHFDNTLTTNYGLAIFSTSTQLHATSTINFNVNGTGWWSIGTSGALLAANNADLALGTGSAISTGGVDTITFGASQAIAFSSYGSGTKTGTATYMLAVDASGNIIEEVLGGGGSSAGSADSIQLSDGAGGFLEGNATNTPTIVLDDATTNSTLIALQIDRTTSATAAGIGSEIRFGLENSAGTLLSTAGQIEFEWLTATAGSEDTRLNVRGYRNGANTSFISINGNGTVGIGPAVATGGFSATAIGDSASAGGSTSLAVGVSASAANTYSIAIGWTASAANQRAIAVGANSQVTGDYGIAIGENAGNASGTHGTSAITIGRDANNGGAVAIGQDSVTIGYLAEAQGIGALAIGYDATAKSSNMVVIGRNALAGMTTHDSNVVAIGYSVGNAAGTLGANSILIGENVGATTGTVGASSVSIGHNVNDGSVTSGAGSIAIGRQVDTTAQGAILLGYNASGTITNDRTDSFALGWDETIPSIWIEKYTGTTSDATANTVIGTIPLDASSTYHVKVVVVGGESDAGGAEYASYEIHGTFYRAGTGNITRVGSDTNVHVAETTGTMDCNLNPSTTTGVQIRVTGIAATNINWRAVVTLTKVESATS